MLTSLDCIPCFLRQALEAVRFATKDTAMHEQVVRSVLRMAAEMDLMQSPPAIAQRIHRLVRKISGVDDPYCTAKELFNRLAMAMLPDLTARLEGVQDPLMTAARLAIAGNTIDLAVNGDLTEVEVHAAFERALSEPLMGDLEAFRQAVAQARVILYLADNAGEITCDRLLIQQLLPVPVTLAVRGGAVVNDATLADAEAAGLHELVEVIDNGSDAPGTILSDCSEDFRRRFAKADLIIAKGQGNFETLSDTGGNIFFLFKVKCPVIAAHVGLPLGTHVLTGSRPTSAPAGGR
jgi:uncharacterized protein with ATP-grasp and redox domains